MNDSMLRGTIGGAALGSGIGGALAWLIAPVMLGLTPFVFLSCGVYAGAVYGGIVGAIRAASRAPQPAYRPATVRRSSA